VRGQAHRVIEPSVYACLFWFEIGAMALLPLVLLSVARVRHSPRGQWTVAALGVFGVVLNRIDTGGLAHLRADGAFYTPSWTEVSISVGIVAAAALLFLFIIERFHIWERRPADPNAQPLRAPEFDTVGATWLGAPSVHARTVYSLAIVVAAAVGCATLTAQHEQNRGREPVPVHRARGGDVLWIDGNLDGFGVAFTHADHIKRGGDKESCVACHHMNLPHDEGSVCASCHSDMYQSADAFRHDWHASPSGANIACDQCHAQDQVRTAKSAVGCDTCHKDMVPANASIQIKSYRAASYTDALHRLCIGCHAEKAVEKNKPEMAQCGWCHKDNRDVVDTHEIDLRRRTAIGGSPVLPPNGQ